MKEKIAIVTGGASGLGSAMVKKFVENGIFTVIIGRNRQKMDDFTRTLGGLAESFVCDLSELDCIHQSVDEITEKYGHIDILVNNAGVHLKKSMFDVTNQEFQKIILTNLTTVFTFSREVSKIMVRQKKGCILNISSMAAHYGIPKVIAYTAAKAGIEGMTRAMAVELSPLGIRVNCVAPGFIKTDMSGSALDNDPERKQKVLSRTPMGKLGSPQDVANAAYFLVSEEASYITGAILTIDGGNSVGF